MRPQVVQLVPSLAKYELADERRQHLSQSEGLVADCGEHRLAISPMQRGDESSGTMAMPSRVERARPR